MSVRGSGTLGAGWCKRPSQPSAKLLGPWSDIVPTREEVSHQRSIRRVGRRFGPALWHTLTESLTLSPATVSLWRTGLCPSQEPSLIVVGHTSVLWLCGIPKTSSNNRTLGSTCKCQSYHLCVHVVVPWVKQAVLITVRTGRSVQNISN